MYISEAKDRFVQPGHYITADEKMEALVSKVFIVL